MQINQTGHPSPQTPHQQLAQEAERLLDFCAPDDVKAYLDKTFFFFVVSDKFGTSPEDDRATYVEIYRSLKRMLNAATNVKTQKRKEVYHA